MSTESNTPTPSSAHQFTDKAFTAISLVCVVSGAIAAFWLLGSPTKQRLVSLDQQRLNALRNIAYQLESEAQLATDINEGKPVLPETLPEAGQYYTQPFTDPVTQEPYEYQRLSDTTYRLCADFALSSDERPLNAIDTSTKWQHSAGRHCFELDVTKPVPEMPYFPNRY